MERSLPFDPPRKMHAVGHYTTREGTASQHIPLPGPSIWPLLLGAATAAFAIGLLLIDSYPWLSLITLPLVLAGILGWALEKPAAQPASTLQAEAMPAMAAAPFADVEMPTLKLGSISIAASPTNAGTRTLADIPTLKLGSVSMAGPSLASSGQFKWGKPTPLPPGPAVTPLPALSPDAQAQLAPQPAPQWGQQNIFQSTPLPQQPPTQLSVPPIQPSYKKRGMKRGRMVALLCSMAIVMFVLGSGLATIVNHRHAFQLPPSAQPVPITVTNTGFSPTSITIKAGTTVIWTNKSTLPHTVTDGGVFDSGNLPVGSSYRLAFAHPGTYHYVCSYHPFMLGTVIVQQT